MIGADSFFATEGGKRPGAGRPRGSGKRSPAAAVPAPDGGQPARSVAERYNEAKAAGEEYRAEKLRLELEALRGTLLDAKSVRKEQERVGRAFRDAMLSVPGRVAALCVGLDERQIERRIMDAITQELTRLADLG